MKRVDEQIHAFLNSPSVLHLAPSTQLNYKRVLLATISDFCEINKIIIVDEDFEDWHERFIEFIGRMNISATTMRQYVTVIKVFMKYNGLDVGFTFKAPASAKKELERKMEKKFFTDKEIVKVLKYAFKSEHERNNLILRMLIDSAMRIGELMKLKVCDFYPKLSAIHVCHSKTRRRYVFLSAKTSAMLEKYIKNQYGDLNARNKERMLFRIGKQTVQKTVCNMLRDMKLYVPGRGPHTFRHYAITRWFYVDELDINDVARLAGDTPEIILQNYIHPSADQMYNKLYKKINWVK